jgi:hypothetical protein
MYTYGKRKSRISNISRIYNFENAQNGNLGPGFFLQKFINPNNNIIQNIIKENLYDLSIYFILSTSTPSDIINAVQNNNTYKLNITNYTINTFNVNAFKVNILNDKNRRFLILDKTTAQNFSNLGIPFFIYDSSNPNVEKSLLSVISSFLFYKTEETLKI